jgi:Ca2+-binding RTX toxin-like protein
MNLEQLESRRHLASSGSAVLTPDGTLTVTGTPGKDEIILIGFSNSVIVNGTFYEFSEDPGVFLRTVVKGLDGDDVVDAAIGFGHGPLLIDLGAGDDELVLREHHAGIIGGTGNDTITFDTTFRLDSFSDAAGVDTIDIRTASEQPALIDMRLYPGLDNLLGARADVIGNDLDNFIEISDGISNPIVFGGPGDDTVASSPSVDEFIGGAGDDTFLDRVPNSIGFPPDQFVGGDGSDTINYSNPRVIPFALTVNLSAGRSSDGDGERATFTGVENAIGGPLGDVLVGDNKNNRLEGGPGDDHITGNGGKDQLIGGEGNDTFLARDNKKDKVNGGDGFDIATLDKKDKQSETESLLA